MFPIVMKLKNKGPPTATKPVLFKKFNFGVVYCFRVFIITKQEKDFVKVLGTVF